MGLVTPTARLSLVADINGRVIGHVMFTPSLLDAPSRLVSVDVLSPLAISPDYQRRGIGGSLIEAGAAIQATRGVPAISSKAIPATTQRSGFQQAGSLGFRRPSPRIPQPAFQVIRLPTYERWMTGTLIYAHQFWDHDTVGPIVGMFVPSMGMFESGSALNPLHRVTVAGASIRMDRG